MLSPYKYFRKGNEYGKNSSNIYFTVVKLISMSQMQLYKNLLKVDIK